MNDQNNMKDKQMRPESREDRHKVMAARQAKMRAEMQKQTGDAQTKSSDVRPRQDAVKNAVQDQADEMIPQESEQAQLIHQQVRSEAKKKMTNKGSKEKKEKNKNGKPRRPLIIVAIILLVLAVVLVGGVLVFYNYSLTPVSSDESLEGDIITIADGATISEVADQLYDMGLVRNAMVFRSYAARHSRGDAQIRAGNYRVSPNMSCQEIFELFVSGVIYTGTIPVVIPEGRNIQEIGEILEENNICTAKDFIAECKEVKKYQAKYPLLNGFSTNEYRNSLEGYVFPATYYFDADMDAAVVVDMMVDAFVDNFSKDNITRAAEMGKSVDEIVTMASLVELETKLDEDKPIAASVFYNRIADGMMLQSDITVDYALGSKHDVLNYGQLEVNSPYNTYQNYGLPIGPICSPGEASIQAALYPDSTSYYYFVADMSTGKLYFSETGDEHYENVEKYMN